MTISAATSQGLGRRQALATLALVAVAAGLMASTAWFAGDLFDRSNVVATLHERLAQSEGRAKPGAAGAGDAQAVGSPFLDGQTITVAGAALQQRVDAAVAKAGGAVLSSQVEVDGPHAADGFVSLTENVEIAQPALQQLLYDIEAGMPYLFIETLAMQTAQGATENVHMMVVMEVTGQWRSPP